MGFFGLNNTALPLHAWMRTAALVAYILLLVPYILSLSTWFQKFVCCFIHTWAVLDIDWNFFSSLGALAFDIEYARWQEDQNRQINELRAAVNAHASDNDLRVIVDGIMAHYEEIFRLKGNAAKADVFHMLSGMWKTPAERCFLWLGGFRSSELLKVRTFIYLPLSNSSRLNVLII